MWEEEKILFPLVREKKTQGLEGEKQRVYMAAKRKIAY